MSIQSPAEKISDTLRGLGSAAYAVGLEDHRRMLRDAAQRTRDGHRAMMQAANVSTDGSDEDDDMGDILVTGDITIRNDGGGKHQGVPQEKPVSQQTTGLSNAAKAAMLGSALLGTGGIGAAIATYMTRQPSPAPIIQPADPTRYGFDLLPPD